MKDKRRYPMMKKGSHLVGDVEYVLCPYCDNYNGQNKQILSPRHLITHNKKLADVISEFPGHITMTKEGLKKHKLKYEKIKRSKEISEDKDIICCNLDCKRKGEPFKGNINLSNKFSECPECKESGYINPKHKEIHEAQIAGMIRNHGVVNPSNSTEIVEKRQKTVDENKKKNPNYYNEIVEKREDRNVEIHGENWKQVFHEKTKKGMKRNHGKEYALQVPEFLEQAQTTYKVDTGFVNAMHNPEVVELFTGKNNSMKKPGVIEKVSESLTESWKKPEVRERRYEAYRIGFMEKLEKYLDLYDLDILEEYRHAHYMHKWKCKICNNIFEQRWNSIQSGFQCEICHPRNYYGSSKAELQVGEFIKDLGFDILLNNRSIIKPYELDIIIPSEKVAIEYNGLYFHQEEIIENTRKNLKVNPRNYHYMKWDMCKDEGYKLITIFEDEWLFKQDLVKERLRYILNKNTSDIVHARKCIIKEIEPKIKNEFLHKYHLQGKDSSVIKLGAFHNDELVSVMTFSHGSISKGIKNRKDKVWELNRFCSDYHYRIPGIASKLLKHFKTNYEWDSIFSFADLRWSNGDLYRKLNFESDNKSTINYWYIDVNKCKRIHRFALRKRPDEPKDITEMVLRTAEGYKILWDCGNLKFTLENK
jgi:hypothetical protein